MTTYAELAAKYSGVSPMFRSRAEVEQELRDKYGRNNIRGIQRDLGSNEPTTGDQYLREWARNRREEEEEKGFFKSLAHGAVAGLLDPFELFGADTDFVKEHERTGMGTLGYGIGYFASFMIPAAATYKVASKALKGLKWVDEGSDLYVRANLLREKTAKEILKSVNWKDEALLGSATGALLGAGMTGRDESLGANVLMGAVTGAVGDPLTAAGMKFAAGYMGRAVTKAIGEDAERIVKRLWAGVPIENADDVDVIARVYNSAEEWYAEALGKAKLKEESVASFKERMTKLGLGRINQMEARILQGVEKGEDTYINRALNLLDENVEYVTVDRANGTKDYLVALRGHMDKKLVEQYQRTAKDGTPWWEGMWVKHNGGEMRVVRRYLGKDGEERFLMASSNPVKRHQKAKPDRGMFDAPTSEVSMVRNVIQRELGPDIPEARQLFAAWMEKNNGTFMATETSGTWEDAVNSFLDAAEGKSATRIVWERGGIGQEESAKGLTEAVLTMDGLESILPKEALSKELDLDTMKFLTNAMDTGQPIARPTLKVELKTVKSMVRELQNEVKLGNKSKSYLDKKLKEWKKNPPKPFLRVVDVDGIKRIRVAQELGKGTVPVDIDIVNRDALSRMGQGSVFKDILDITTVNRFQARNGVVMELGEAILDVADRPVRTFTGPEREAIKGYFAEQTFRELGKVDPELYSKLFKSYGMKPYFHNADKLIRMASESGHAVAKVIDPDTGDIKILIKDIMPTGDSPGAELIVENEGMAFSYLSKRVRELPDLTAGVNLPTRGIAEGASRGLPISGTNQIDGKFTLWKDIDLDDPSIGPHLRQTIEEGVKLGAWWRLAPLIAPREALLRELNDAIIRQTGVDLGITKVMHDFMQATDKMRFAQKNGLRYVEGQEGARGTLGIDELIEIRGGTGAQGRLKGTQKKSDALDLLVVRNKERRTQQAIEEFGFTKDEVAVMDELEDYIIRLFEDARENGMWSVTGEEFLQYYWTPIRSAAISRTKGKWDAGLRESLKAKGITPDEAFIKFQSEMSKYTGSDPAFETDPFMLPMRYLRAIASKRHLEEATVALNKTLDNIDKLGKSIDNADLKFVHGQLKGYAETMVGMSPEHYATARVFFSKTFEDVGIELKQRDFDKLVNTMMSLNYGAFMGLRPGLAIRNISQLLAVTLPVVQSPSAMAHGIRMALTKEGRNAARKAGAVAAEHGIPFEDVLYTSRLYDAMLESGRTKGKVFAGGQRVRRWLEDVSEVTLGNKNAGAVIGRDIKVFGQDVKIGFYSTADEFNRTVSYHAMRKRAEEPLNKALAGEMDMDEAMKKAGITFMGESHVNEVKRLLETSATTEEALSYIGVRASHETQWIYKQGAGPAWMSHGVGRLLGQYGTWPAWYAANIYRGAINFKRDPVGAARFFGWNAVFMGAVSGATALTGYDWGKYNPLFSITWAGGPLFDYVKDVSDVISGLDSGDANATLALSRMGYSAGQWNPAKSFEYFGSPLIPGSLAIREFLKAGGYAADGEVGSALIKGLLSTNPVERDNGRLDFTTRPFEIR